MTTAASHVWRFRRVGGFDQVRLESGADLAALDQLDQKLWVALSCPTRGLEFDPRTLDLIDTDGDGRVRAPEIIAAVRWTCRCLKNPDDLLKGASALPLNAIDGAQPEGKRVLASAKHILSALGKPDAAAITVEDTADRAKVFAQARFNGDGVVPPDSAGDPAVKAAIEEIITCLGGNPDRSGKPGIGQTKLDQFFAEAQAFSDWWKKAETDSAILPVGGSTETAAAAIKTIRTKVDDYFARCRLAAFDARALLALNREEKEYLALAAKDLTITSAEIAAFPLSRIEPGKPLSLKEGVNPAWAGALAGFQADVVKPLLGDKPALSEAEWQLVLQRFAAYDAWAAGKAGAAVERLGLKRVRDLLAGKTREAVSALIAQDQAIAPEADAADSVEKLVRCHRDLYKLLINFVSFQDFYGRKDKSVFQAGTLYLDQRSCDLCIRVENAGKHATVAALSGACLAYCDCTRKATGEAMTIAAALTDGDSDNITVGRNGLFYDRHGRDWDATVTKIIDNPISIRQAFWAPYKKLVRFIEDQVGKRAAAADTASGQRLTGSVLEAGKTVETGKAPDTKPKLDTGLIAALGVAAAGIGGMLGAIVGAFLGLGVLMPVGAAGLLLLISGPSMAMAWLKLRRRNLGPLLDANGWAVNARAKINVPFGRSLTKLAELPPGAQRDLVDPFAEDDSGSRKLVLGIVLIVLVWALWYFGLLSQVVPGLPKPAHLQNPPPKISATNAPAG